MHSEKHIHITLVRSPIGCLPKHKASLATMGLRRLRQVVSARDNAATRGILNQIRYLVKVEGE